MSETPVTDDSPFGRTKISCDSVLHDLPIQTQEDYRRLKSEVRSFSVSLGESPTVQSLSSEIYQIQAIKDRLSEIYGEAHNNFIVRKRVFDLLEAAYIPYSVETSVDRRKGDAAAKLCDYHVGCTQAEGFYRFCVIIMSNLDSMQEMVSRRITCFGHQLKIDGIIGSNPYTSPALPDAPSDVRNVDNTPLKPAATTGEISW